LRDKAQRKEEKENTGQSRSWQKMQVPAGKKEKRKLEKANGKEVHVCPPASGIRGGGGGGGGEILWGRE